MLKSRVSMLCDQLRLSPYQSYILQNNASRYNLSKLARRGGILYAPYAHDGNGIRDFCFRILRGPRADLIGLDRVLVCGQRGIRIYASGVFSAYHNGGKYYADSYGNRMPRGLFLRVAER